MAQRTHYTPGTFSWADLSAPDQAAAKAFYTSLFDWQTQDMPVQDGAVYTMAFVDGKPVGAISPQPQGQRDAGAPAMWNSYISVESADATLARVAELGGHVHAGPFDVLSAGRMGVVQDPQGAFFEVWEARDHIGAGLVNGHGMLSWNELATPDLDGAERFYGALFGWEVSEMPGMPMPYRIIRTAAGTSNGAITVPGPAAMPPHWLVYFGTENIEVSVEKIGALDGGIIAGPMDIGVGRIAVAHDPQGAVFALYSGDFDD